ncbi:hypothetical protein OAU13_00840 [bacterium]|nr:hypothetical protein [bacterium]
MTIKKHPRNKHFDDYEDRPSKPKQKDRNEKRLRNALRTNDIDSLYKYSDDYNEHFDDYDYDYRR